MLLLCLLGYHVFLPLYQSNNVIIDYGLSPFNICSEQPLIWKYCKYWFVLTYTFSSLFISNASYNMLSKILSIFPSKVHKKKLIHKNDFSIKAKPKYSFISPPKKMKLELCIRRI